MTRPDLLAAAVAVTLVAGVASGVGLLMHAATAPTPESDAGAVIFGAGLPVDAGVQLPDATLARTSKCFAWQGGSAPVGTVYYQTLVYADADDDRALLLASSSGTDAGAVAPALDRMFVLQVGIVPGDAGVVEIAKLRQFLENHNLHEVDKDYRCRIGSVGCPATPANTGCEVYATRFTDASAPTMCMCGSGSQWSRNGTTWFAANPDQVYGRPYGVLVRCSGAGNCRNVPCGVLAGNQNQLDGVCQ